MFFSLNNEEHHEVKTEIRVDKRSRTLRVPLIKFSLNCQTEPISKLTDRLLLH